MHCSAMHILSDPDIAASAREGVPARSGSPMKVYGGVGLITITWPASPLTGPASATNKAGPLPPVMHHTAPQQMAPRPVNVLHAWALTSARHRSFITAATWSRLIYDEYLSESRLEQACCKSLEGLAFAAWTKLQAWKWCSMDFFTAQIGYLRAQEGGSNKLAATHLSQGRGGHRESIQRRRQWGQETASGMAAGLPPACRI